jgi:hypothetical protein
MFAYRLYAATQLLLCHVFWEYPQLSDRAFALQVRLAPAFPRYARYYTFATRAHATI